MKNLPEKIYLDLGESIENIEDFDSRNKVTWSVDNATGVGIEYVRKDVAEEMAKDFVKYRDLGISDFYNNLPEDFSELLNATEPTIDELFTEFINSRKA